MKVIEEGWCSGNNSYLTNGADVERYKNIRIKNKTCILKSGSYSL